MLSPPINKQHVMFYQASFSALLIHKDRLLSKFRSCAPCGTESSAPFSTRFFIFDSVSAGLLLFRIVMYHNRKKLIIETSGKQSNQYWQCFLCTHLTGLKMASLAWLDATNRLFGACIFISRCTTHFQQKLILEVNILATRIMGIIESISPFHTPHPPCSAINF